MKKISLNLFDARVREGEGEREKRTEKKKMARRGEETTGEGGRDVSAFAAESG